MNNRLLFDRMFKEWYTHFFYFAYQFINDAEVCKDVVNDAFEYLWRNYDKMEEATVKAYLYAMIRTRCIDYLRRQNVHEDYLDFASQLTRQLVETEESEEDDRMMSVRNALKKLTPYNRYILEQCYVYNKKYREVAEELGVSVAAIHKNIVKALHILRKELGQDGNR